MVLERIDYIRDFIDYLHFEYSKYLYKNERGWERSPLQIFNSWSWRYREDYLTLTNDDCSSIDEEWLDFTIGEYIDNNYIPGCTDIRHGVEQIAFIFEDVVYKISSNDVGNIIDNLKENISDQYHNLFCSYTWLERYKGCHIYIQEKVEPYEFSSKQTPYSELSKEQQKTINNMDYYINMSDDCVAAIVLEEGLDYFVGLCADLKYAGYRYDIHQGNFGFNEKGQVRIFDPIYENTYY